MKKTKEKPSLLLLVGQSLKLVELCVFFLGDFVSLCVFSGSMGVLDLFCLMFFYLYPGKPSFGSVVLQLFPSILITSKYIVIYFTVYSGGKSGLTSLPQSVG